MKKQSQSPMKLVEAAFCIAYLIFVYIATLLFLWRGQHLYAALAFCLALGDSFHLFPRIKIALKGEGKDDFHRLQLGNIISSVTVTLFYVILYFIMKQIHADLPVLFLHLLLALGAVRIYMLTMPQNDWFKRNSAENNWHIYRNIPFCLMGIVTIFYLILFCKRYFMALLVLISFACYMGTVILAKKNPKMGMLMIPKTICYIWILAMFL